MSIPLIIISLYVVVLYAVAFYSTRMLKEGDNDALTFLLAGKSFQLSFGSNGDWLAIGG